MLGIRRADDACQLRRQMILRTGERNLRPTRNKLRIHKIVFPLQRAHVSVFLRFLDRDIRQCKCFKTGVDFRRLRDHDRRDLAAVRPPGREDKPWDQPEFRIDLRYELQPRICPRLRVNPADDIICRDHLRRKLVIVEIERRRILRGTACEHRDQKHTVRIVRCRIVNARRKRLSCGCFLHLQCRENHRCGEFSRALCNRDGLIRNDVLVFCRVKNVHEHHRRDIIERELRLHKLAKRILLPIIRVAEGCHRLVIFITKKRRIRLYCICRQMQRCRSKNDGKPRADLRHRHKGSRHLLPIDTMFIARCHYASPPIICCAAI